MKKFKAAVISVKFILKILPLKKWNEVDLHIQYQYDINIEQLNDAVGATHVYTFRGLLWNYLMNFRILSFLERLCQYSLMFLLCLNDHLNNFSCKWQMFAYNSRQHSETYRSFMNRCEFDDCHCLYSVYRFYF